MAGGYLNRPDKTAEVFTDNPFDGGAYSALYHSGDVVRFRMDGNIEFIGRRDGQVKIRGFRIELSEVEAVIRDYPGVKDATVAAFDHPVDGKFVCAYVVGDTELDIEGIKGFIKDKKPPYMVPAVIMQIDEIPLNQNSKVNKRALPKPELTESVSDEAPSDRPFTMLEERMSKVVKETAGISVSDVGASLLDLGLTSISAISLVAKFKDELLIDVPVKKILSGASLIDIENDVVKDLMERKGEASEEEAYDLNLDRYPLSQSQFGIYSECMMEPDSTRYNISYCYEIPGEIGAGRLQDAVKQVIELHPALKCTIEPDDTGEVFMWPHDDREAEVPMLSGSRDECGKLWQDFVKPFDLKKSLYNIAVFDAGESVFLLLDVNHIIFDGTSLGIFFEDLNDVLDRKEQAPERRSQFEYALVEKKALSSKDFDEAKAYYEGLMRGWSGGGRCTVPDPDLNIPEEISGFDVIERRELSAASVNEWCKSHSATPNAFFMAAAGIALSKYNFAEDICFTSIYNGRNDADIARSVGMFVKTYPVRCFPDGDTPVSDFVEGIGKQILQNMSNDLYSFANISRSFGVSADFMLVYQGISGGFGGDEIGGFNTKQPYAKAPKTQEDISIDIWEYDGYYRFEANYRANKYSAGYISRFIDVLETTAIRMLKADTISDIDITSESELKLVESFNETDYPVDMVSVNRLFEAQVKAHPEMTAVIADGKSLTYDELNKNANSLANSLISRGISIGDIAGIVLDRTVDVYIAEYGILKSGGAFLPMAKAYPDDRIDFCLRDAGCRFVITTGEIKNERAELFTDDKPYTCLTVEELIKNPEKQDPNLHIPADSLAYCIYTSGSTGRPKGVMIEHGNLCNFVNPNEKNDETRLLVYPGEVMLALAAISFDVSIMESFIPLTNGMTACMANEDEIHNPLLLCDLVEKNHVSVLCATPSFLTNIADIPRVKEAFNKVKAYDVGAEAFPASLYDGIRGMSPDALIINGYGPTETTISCIAKVMESGENITIGKPAANVRAYVMDRKSHILPVGVLGELVICGKGVGRGYMNLPDKTKEAFITVDGRRAYRSGDLVRYNASGEIEFMGRLDNQVKLRGLRVELDEIENVMNEYPGVLVSKVIVRNNGKEDYLAGFFTATEKVDISGLTSSMKGKLTEYMIPAVMMQLDEMPLTVNGKIDKNALPDTAVTIKEREYTEPSGELETEFCRIFSEVLTLPRVGALDDFFEIGGTSLSATKVVMQAINKGYNIVYKDVFEHPTPRELAAFIGGGIKVNVSGTSDSGETFDYSEINRILSNNILERVDDVKKTELNGLILTGATGFLGIHILREYLTSCKGTVYCLLRSKDDMSCEKRLKNMLVYYFNDPFDEYFGDRIVCIEGDITDRKSLDAVAKLPADTVINCAACVKHFVKDDILDRVNVGGVKNLIDMCISGGKRLIQISTTSVAGEAVASDAVRLLHENELYFGQRLDNDYVRTKFLAERAVLGARAEDGLRGMVIRVGNLMSRRSDGEFQINFVTNSFMRSLKAYRKLKLFPVDMLEAEAEFSPIDTTAQAILCLASSKSSFSVFHAYNDHILKMADVIYAMRDYGFDIDITDAASFASALGEATKDESMADAVLGLIAYDSGQGEEIVEIGANNRFSANVLYRLGFKWCITDDEYLKNSVKALDTLGFFD